jgi:hypothetical protein
LGVAYFQDRVSGTIFLGWLQTMILLISASQVAKITGMSQQRLAIKVDFLRYSLHQGISCVYV